MILKTLIETNPKYAALRLRKTIVDKKKRTVNYVFSYPNLLTIEEKNDIIALVKKLSPPSFTTIFSFELDQYDVNSAKKVVLEVIEKEYNSLYNRQGLEVIVNSGTYGSFDVKIKIDSIMAKTLEHNNFLESITQYFRNFSSVPFRFTLDVFMAEVDLPKLISVVEDRLEMQITAEMSKPIHHICVSDVTKFLGREIISKPRYIMDITKPVNMVTLCGKISKIKTFESQKTTSLICKFDLTDFTGKISVVYFAKNDNKQKFLQLYEDQEVVVNGVVEMSDYSHQLELKAFSISKCKIVAEEEQPKYVKPLQNHYITVKPEKIETYEQISLTKKERFISDYLKNKTFVVFDFETTGLNFFEDKITEIGAIKIYNGQIVESFTTLVNPQRKISEKAKSISHITDEMLADAPLFSFVVGDFYRFCFGATLIGHNVEFDYGFLKYYSTPAGYIFDNEMLDTIELSQKFFARNPSYPKKPANNRLVTIANVFGLEFDILHRGLDDAMLTAKLFLKLLEQDPKLL